MSILSALRPPRGGRNCNDEIACGAACVAQIMPADLDLASFARWAPGGSRIGRGDASRRAHRTQQCHAVLRDARLFLRCRSSFEHVNCDRATAQIEGNSIREYVGAGKKLQRPVGSLAPEPLDRLGQERGMALRCGATEGDGEDPLAGAEE